MNRFRAAIAAALLLVMSISGTALAASSQSSTMTLTVGNSITVADVPASLTFTGFAGETVSAAPFTPTLTATSSATFTATTTALSDGGTESISASAVTANGNALPWDIFTGTSYSGGDITVAIAIPLAQATGTYTGTFTISGS